MSTLEILLFIIAVVALFFVAVCFNALTGYIIISTWMVGFYVRNGVFQCPNGLHHHFYGPFPEALILLAS